MASGSGSGGQRRRVAVAEGPRQDLRKKKKKLPVGWRGVAKPDRLAGILGRKSKSGQTARRVSGGGG